MLEPDTPLVKDQTAAITTCDGRKVKLLNGELIDVAKRKKNYFLKCWYAAA